MDHRAVWDSVLRRLRTELPSFVVDSWVRPLALEPTGADLRLLCPTAFHRDRVRERYLERIASCAAQELGHAVVVDLQVSKPASRCPELEREGDGSLAPQRDAGRSGAASPDAERRASGRTVESADAVERTRALAATTGRAAQTALPHTFESFVVGDCNALAQAASREVARGRRRLSPLFLASAPGLGKTHLARALVSEVERRAGERVIYSPAELFTNELTAAIRAKTTQSFKRRYRGCDVLVIEDVQFLRGKAATQLELFHTIDHLLLAGRRIVLTGDRLPREIQDLEPRLSSRMASGLVAEIERPDVQVRRRILKSKAAAGGVHLPEDCLDRLVEAVRGSVRDLEGALIQLVASASLLSRAIDLELTDAALHKIEPIPSAAGVPLAPKAVIGAVSAFFQVTPATLATRSRRRDVVLPRQLAMVLCRRYSEASLPEIGRAFGRKHSSVSNAIARVERQLLERAPLRYQFEALCGRLDALSGRMPQSDEARG